MINLIADIGGTNIRIAQAETTNHTKDIETYRCSDFSNLADVLATYINNKRLQHSTINACLAIACPVDDDIISMTNLPWQFSQVELKKNLGLNKLTFINDYTAIAMAIPFLNDNQKVKVGGGEVTEHKPISVCGPGTGLGVASLMSINGKLCCISGEGGHIDYAPVGKQEIEVLNYLNTIKQRVSYEQLLSGYGIEQIYKALNFIEKNELKSPLKVQEICAKALKNSCPICYQTLLIFCEVLGSFAGNLALILNSQGGCYIAGGIVPRFIDFLKLSKFRERFETKGRLSHLTQKIPTYIITETQPGLLGAAAYSLQ